MVRRETELRTCSAPIIGSLPCRSVSWLSTSSEHIAVRFYPQKEDSTAKMLKMHLDDTGSQDRTGSVDNVVFPTAVDARANGRIDIYYGMADARIGVARMNVPRVLPSM